MTKILTRLNIKIVFRSPIYYIAWFFLSFAFAFFAFVFNKIQNDAFKNFFIAFDSMVYYEIGLYIILFCLAVFFSQKECLLEEICFVPKEKIYFSRLIAVYSSSLLFVLIPVIYMISFSIVQDIGFDFLIRALCYVVVRWSLIIFFIQTIGFTIGYLVHMTYSYLFGVPITIIFSYLNSGVFGSGNLSAGDTDLPIAHLFSLQRNFLSGTFIDFRGPLFDAEFFVKVLFFLFLTAIVQIVLFVIIKKRFTHKAIWGLCFCLICCVIAGITYVDFHPNTYMDDQKLYITKFEPQSYEIVSYSGKIHLDEWASYDVSITFKGSGENVKIRIDESIDIEYLKIDGSLASYTREGDYVIINGLSTAFSLDLSVTGRVSYTDSVGSRNIYTSVSGCSLPSDFAFLPRIDGDLSEKTFDLTVFSSKFLATNLEYSVDDDEYIINDKAYSACFFTGDFQTFENNGIRYYTAKYDVTKDQSDYVALFEKRSNVTLTYFDPQTYSYCQDEQQCIESWNNVKTVFFITYMYPGHFPAVYDDYAVLPLY